MSGLAPIAPTQRDDDPQIQISRLSLDEWINSMKNYLLNYPTRPQHTQPIPIPTLHPIGRSYMSMPHPHTSPARPSVPPLILHHRSRSRLDFQTPIKPLTHPLSDPAKITTRMRAIRVDIVLSQRLVVPRWDGRQVGITQDNLSEVVKTVVAV